MFSNPSDDEVFEALPLSKERDKKSIIAVTLVHIAQIPYQSMYHKFMCFEEKNEMWYKYINKNLPRKTTNKIALTVRNSELMTKASISFNQSYQTDFTSYVDIKIHSDTWTVNFYFDISAFYPPSLPTISS